MRWRLVLPFLVIAVMPAAALAAGKVAPLAPPAFDLDLSADQAVSSLLGVSALGTGEGRGAGGLDVKLETLDFFAAKGAATTAVFKRFAVVPEPGTGLLFLLGLSALALRRR